MMHWMQGLGLTPSGVFHKSGAKADVRVHVRAGVVQVQRRKTGIGGIVAGTTTDRQAIMLQQISPFAPA